VTSARLQGLEADLGLTGQYSIVLLSHISFPFPSDIQYDTVVAILYASYCPAQVRVLRTYRFKDAEATVLY
jgi:hypothetical protein